MISHEYLYFYGQVITNYYSWNCKKGHSKIVLGSNNCLQKSNKILERNRNSISKISSNYSIISSMSTNSRTNNVTTIEQSQIYDL